MNREIDFDRLVELCRWTHEETQRSAARAVDRSLVVRNWLFGCYIVEYEQSGADRAKYGAQTLTRLAAALKVKIGRGFSVDALERMRRFYLGYAHVVSDAPAADKSATLSRISGHREISETPLRNSPAAPVGTSHAAQTPLPLSAELGRHLTLGWSHYVTLLSVSDIDVRRFYEIEAKENDWSVRELKRQIASSLYERLALSRDKPEVRRLACEGQVVEKASDLIKDPLVLEFLGLEQKPAIPRPHWKPRSSTACSTSCLNSARASSSSRGRSASASAISTSSSIWCSTTGCCAATS